MYRYNWDGQEWGPINMMWEGQGWWLDQWPLLAAVLLPFIFAIVLWSVFWKGLALWHAARRGEPAWFVAILLINTLGILEIIYLFSFAKLKVSELFGKHEHHTH